ncbi:MAG: cytochrome C, partial [Bacteroidetes bacterium]|nr:cytochrome C [Bacteroidota bacterium]
YSARKKDHKLEELVEFVEAGEMPLDSYTWIHGDLSKKDAKLLIQWVEILRIGYQKEIAGLLK